MGLSQIKNSVSYVWLAECVSMPMKPAAYTYINIIDAIPMAVFCAYVSYIDKNWLSINMYALGISYLAFFLAFLCPESPRWYLVNGKRKKAIKTLNYMAKFNGALTKIPKDAQFVEDPNIFAHIAEEANPAINVKPLNRPSIEASDQKKTSN